MTTQTDFSLAGLGLPSETELETLAGSLFSDFDPITCARGIESLAESGDTAVINRAAQKAQSVFGSSDYERVVDSLVLDYNLPESQTTICQCRRLQSADSAGV